MPHPSLPVAAREAVKERPAVRLCSVLSAPICPPGAAAPWGEYASSRLICTHYDHSTRACTHKIPMVTPALDHFADSSPTSPEFREVLHNRTLTASHSIISSARSRNDLGIVSPSVMAVWRLMTDSYLVGISTGNSLGNVTCSPL